MSPASGRDGVMSSALGRDGVVSPALERDGAVLLALGRDGIVFLALGRYGSVSPDVGDEGNSALALRGKTRVVSLALGQSQDRVPCLEKKGRQCPLLWKVGVGVVRGAEGCQWQPGSRRREEDHCCCGKGTHLVAWLCS